MLARRMRLWWGVCALWLCVHAGVCAQAQDADKLTQQRAQARAQQTVLRERLAALQQTIAEQDAQRRDVLAALRASESAISDLTRALQPLHQQVDALQSDLARVRDDSARQTRLLNERRQALAEMLRAQYMGGLSPWTALFAGEDLHAIGRNLGYFAYVAQAQTEAVRGVQQTLASLQQLHVQALTQQEALDALLTTTQARNQALQEQQREQQQQLHQLDRSLRARRTQADALFNDVRGLETLVSRLEAEIAQQQAAGLRELQQAPSGLNRQEGLEGLQAKLPHPVVGDMVGKFGAERPEGGLWRGVMIRADGGSAVRAVATGRVVYAQWLTGFGNLMIVDHGAQYLTVYAYNQSLLHTVGDRVDAGETLALVGATGGQVEPGLYFEIRHKGAPVNPRLWLQP